MKVRGDNAPNVSFSVEDIPNRPGSVLVRFYDAVETYTQENNGQTQTGYMYDEYHLELNAYNGIEDDIANNYYAYFEEAVYLDNKIHYEQRQAEKVQALESENALLRQQISALSDQNDFQEELIVELANVVYA